jgi:Uma2 family endonuclease
MGITTHPPMTLEEYLKYDPGENGTDTRYELVDGILIPMGTEHPINFQIAGFLFSIFLSLGLPHYRIVIGHQIEVSSKKATARQPDLIVHSEASEAAISQDGKLLRLNAPVPMVVVEVVSNSDTDPRSWERDYQEKRREYEIRSIPEYWIVDPAADVVLVLTLNADRYQEQRFQGGQLMISPTFPQLALVAAQVLAAGKAK